MSKLLHSCMAKATTAEGEQLQYGPNWVLARRATLKIFDDHLECGDWSVPYEQMQSATLYSIRSFLLVPSYVLQVNTTEKQYHFGLNWGAFWKEELPFKVNREKGKVKYSKFSIVVRLLLLSYVIYYLLR